MERNIYSIDEIREKIIPLLKHSNIKKAVLFGSYAKKCATNRSDIDIFIDSGGVLNGLNFFSLYSQMEACFDKKLDLIEAIEVEKESRIYSEIEKYGVVLYEQ